MSSVGQLRKTLPKRLDIVSLEHEIHRMEADLDYHREKARISSQPVELNDSKPYLAGCGIRLHFNGRKALPTSRHSLNTRVMQECQVNSRRRMVLIWDAGFFHKGIKRNSLRQNAKPGSRPCRAGSGMYWRFNGKKALSTSRHSLSTRVTRECH